MIDQSDAPPVQAPVPHAVLWVLAHKAQLAAACKIVAGLIATLLVEGIVAGQAWKAAGISLFYFGGVLLGGGEMKSDSYYRPQLAAADLVAAKEAVVAAEAPKEPPQ